MLRHRADCADGQRAGHQDQPEIASAHSSAEFNTNYSDRRGSGCLPSLVRVKGSCSAQDTIGQKSQVSWIRARHNLPARQYHKKDKCSNDLKSEPPSESLTEGVYQKRSNGAPQA